MDDTAKILKLHFENEEVWKNWHFVCKFSLHSVLKSNRLIFTIRQRFISQRSACKLKNKQTTSNSKKNYGKLKILKIFEGKHAFHLFLYVLQSLFWMRREWKRNTSFAYQVPFELFSHVSSEMTRVPHYINISFVSNNV